MKINKTRLHELYVTKQKSVAEIAELFACSQNKINYWLNKFDISKRSISEAIYVKANPSGDPFSRKKIVDISDAKLLGLGLGLYWGEGTKRNKNSVRLGNTDPDLF